MVPVTGQQSQNSCAYISCFQHLGLYDSSIPLRFVVIVILYMDDDSWEITLTGSARVLHHDCDHMLSYTLPAHHSFYQYTLDILYILYS